MQRAFEEGNNSRHYDGAPVRKWAQAGRMKNSQYIIEVLKQMNPKVYGVYVSSSPEAQKDIIDTFILGERTRAEAQFQIFSLFPLSRFFYRVALKCLKYHL